MTPSSPAPPPPRLRLNQAVSEVSNQDGSKADYGSDDGRSHPGDESQLFRDLMPSSWKLRPK